MHVAHGLRQALVLCCGCTLAALAAGGVWWALQGGGFRVKFAVALLVVAGLLALAGGNVLSRSGTAEIRALMGTGPDHEDPSTGASLTGVGRFLFVSLPLFVAGGLLYGTVRAQWERSRADSLGGRLAALTNCTAPVTLSHRVGAPRTLALRQPRRRSLLRTTTTGPPGGDRSADNVSNRRQQYASLGPRSRGARYGAAAAASMVAISAALLASAGTAQAVAVPVPMGTAEPFAVLGGTGISNTGTTTINGDIGSLPNPVMTGAGSVVLTGTDHAGDGVTATAKDDLTAAYLAAAGQTSDFPVVADLAGQTLTPGVYTTASGLQISGPVPLTLNGGPNDVFVFQAGSSLITSANTSVVLTGGVTPCNVFWQVGSSTTLGVNSDFVGTILTLSDSTMDTGATLEGSLLTRNGAVTLDSNTILRPACASPVTGGTTTVAAPLSSGTTSGQVRRVPRGAVDAGGTGTDSVVGRLWSSS